MRCLSPANLLAVANIDAVDVVVIDAEGMDAEIVAAFLPLRPRVLIFGGRAYEQGGPTGPPQQARRWWLRGGLRISGRGWASVSPR